MMIAVSMVKAFPGEEKSLYRSLKNTDGVKNLYHVFGDHDFFLILEAKSKGILARKIDEIRRITHVTAVDTLLIGKNSHLDEWRSSETLAA